ncbi:MAG: ABC transporter substrate-binding protein [Thermomicrobiales bacterium]
MSVNSVSQLNELYRQFCHGAISRRELVRRAGALGISAASLSIFLRAVPASAQDATPGAASAFTSINREEWAAQLNEWWTAKEEPASQGGTVILGEIASSNLTTTNMMISNNSPTNPVLALVYETLVASSPIDGQYVPGLADFWEIAEDGKTYTFHLNSNAVWHDGTPLTADDVIFSMDAQSDPLTGSSYTGSFNDTVASYTKVDDQTVQVVSSDVLAQVVFLGNFYCPIVAKHIWESVPFDQWQTDAGSTGADPARVIGSGPFVFQELNEGEGTATFVRNENYWDTVASQAPTIDTFIFQTWPDETSAIEALRAGNIDIYDGVPPADVESVQSEDSLEVALYDTYSFSWYGYNLDPEKTPLFQDARTRQALFYALDRQSLVDNVMLGYAEVANGTQPILSLAYAPDQITTVYNYDPEQAMALLAEAGWVDEDGDGVLELDGNKLEFEIMYGSGSATSDQIIAYVQEAWGAVGAAVTPNPVDFDTVLVPALVENFDYAVCFLGFNWDATGDQTAMFATNNYKQGFNAMKYSNPDYDELAARASREIDPEARRQLLIEASNIVNEDLPVGILWFRKDRTGYNVRVHNYAPNAQAGFLWPLPFLWVEE